jgi:hypothetical protein
VTVTTERANPLRRRNPGWGGRSTARRPVAAMSKLFLRPPVLVKRFTCEMTLRKRTSHVSALAAKDTSKARQTFT